MGKELHPEAKKLRLNQYQYFYCDYPCFSMVFYRFKFPFKVSVYQNLK